MRQRHYLYVYPFVVLLPVLLLLYLGSAEAVVYAAGPGQQQASFSVSRHILSFTGVEGGSAPRVQWFEVTNTGSGPINWSVSVDGDAAWLDVVPTSGLDDGIVRVGVDTTGLISGTFTETLTVSAQETTAVELIRVTLMVASEVTSLYAEDFDTYASGADPVDWFDMGAHDSLEEDLFKVFDLDGGRVLGTVSILGNIHSHYVGAGSEGFSSYEYTGRMRMASSGAGMGVTFLSQVPERDAYYRLLRYGSGSFHLSPHGTVISGGTTDTGVVPALDKWYLFRVWVEDVGARTEIRAKVWGEGDPEPSEWQVDCYDANSTRLMAGTVGVWSGESGGTYWDDLEVNPLPPGPDESPPFAHGHDPGLGAANVAPSSDVVVHGADSGEGIDVWYGSHQVFGELGNPQRWVNILGNVSDPDEVISLTYSLNSGPELPLSIGPDTRRLTAEGDFNVEISRTALISGLNPVVITATDSFNNQTVETVTVEYVEDHVWPETYSIDWSTVTAIPDVAQIVDGLWTLEADSIHPEVMGYDRLVAIGDMDASWDDYEVIVPITIHEVDPAGYFYPSGGPGVGILMRWDGHYDWLGWQPTIGWYPIGALGWYRWRKDTLGDRLMMIGGNYGNLLTEDTSGRKLAYSVPYLFKMRVETISGQGDYGLKVWEEGQPEPSAWDLTVQGVSGPQYGSFLLLAHHVDASFGDVVVIPGPFDQDGYILTVTTIGDGEVAVEPDPPYTYGQVVTLTATADLGWTFTGWDGDLSGDNNPEELAMHGHKAVTATFTQDEIQIFLPLITVQGSP